MPRLYTAGTRPIATVEDVSLLTSSGITVSRETRLSPSIMNEMSNRLTEKFQRKLRSTWRSNVMFDTQKPFIFSLPFDKLRGAGSMVLYVFVCRFLPCGAKNDIQKERNA